VTIAATILITMDDLETAVPLNAAFEEAGFGTDMVSSLDDASRTVKRVKPDLVILTGAVHEPRAAQLAELAHQREIPSLALLEATDSDQGGGPRSSRLSVTEVLA
jgi:DNA-binding response OmpR family regulator